MIGIMADSHDNLHAVKKAVQLFKDAGCKLVIHAGDFVAPFAARELENLNCPVKAVFGNCDGEKKGLEKTVSSFGEIQESPLIFSHDGLDFFGAQGRRCVPHAFRPRETHGLREIRLHYFCPYPHA